LQEWITNALMTAEEWVTLMDTVKTDAAMMIMLIHKTMITNALMTAEEWVTLMDTV
jgi:hypothetical protein